MESRLDKRNQLEGHERDLKCERRREEQMHVGVTDLLDNKKTLTKYYGMEPEQYKRKLEGYTKLRHNDANNNIKKLGTMHDYIGPYAHVCVCTWLTSMRYSANGKIKSKDMMPVFHFLSTWRENLL